MEVVLARSTVKNYRQLPSNDRKRIKKRLVSLSSNPLAGKKLKGKLKSWRSLRVWPYRIIYQINKQNERLEVVAV